MQRAPRVVLVGDRRAEQRHDAIAGELVHRAFPVVDGVQHELEGAVHQLMELLRVEGAGQLGRALHVDEEDGHVLPFAAERSALGENALGEVPRRV